MYRKAHEDLVQFYKKESGLLDCTDIGDLKQTLHINHNPLDWQLFTDSPNLCLKAVLFHNGNTLPYNSVGHSAHNKSHMRTWRLYWKPLTRWIQMENLRRLSYYLDYNKDSQNIAASFVNGTAVIQDRTHWDLMSTAKCPKFSPILTKFGCYRQIVIKTPISRKSVQVEPQWHMWTDGWTKSLKPLHSKAALSWRSDVVDNNITSLGLRVKF